ncbi:Respiratory supercomplex factor 2, mitochondrial [Grifola frondosa]|uniref:Respiratory supercomplex factor 2, mitochondrial n=1 Tax=Grifola frondosa TaxID=5627 RepID=A0A1C7M223_GRIFR|nr:Respiratory supercomplex factor 2, mitochondrial [Grifola frondosa]
MKFASEEELHGHNAATVRGAIEGIVGGFAISLPASFYMQRKWAYYRSLPITIKTLGVVLVVVPCYAIQAERRGVEYAASIWTGAGKAELQREEAVAQRHWDTLTTTEKVKDWSSRNQYKLILGSWALSMAIAGSIVMRNPHQSSAQKIVQARMWAQGLTVGVMIGAGILTHAQRKEAAAHRLVDHSWVNILEEQRKVDEANKLRLLSASPHTHHRSSFATHHVDAPTTHIPSRYGIDTVPLLVESASINPEDQIEMYTSPYAPESNTASEVHHAINESSPRAGKARREISLIFGSRVTSYDSTQTRNVLPGARSYITRTAPSL